jgi:hypothetical protein
VRHNKDPAIADGVFVRIGECDITCMGEAELANLVNHADIKTTTKYADVVDDEVAAGIEAMQRSQKKSRRPARKAS